MYTKYGKIQSNTPFVHLRILTRAMKGGPPKHFSGMLLGLAPQMKAKRHVFKRYAQNMITIGSIVT
jgi:hypothetical protein